MNTFIVKLAKKDPFFRRVLIQKLAEEEEKSKSLDKKGPPAGWEDFWNKVYDGGKKKVRNPNPKGSKKQVSASTAMKNDSFKKNTMKEFFDWRKKNKESKGKESAKLKLDNLRKEQEEDEKYMDSSVRRGGPDNEKKLREIHSRSEKVLKELSDFNAGSAKPELKRRVNQAKKNMEYAENLLREYE